jgi:hypothetical protein
MDTIIPDVDNTRAVIEGALPILHIPDGASVGRPAIVEALARLNAMDKMQAAGAVFTRAQVEGLGWPAGTHIDWVEMQPSSPQHVAPPTVREAVLERRVATLEVYLRNLYRALGLAE